MRGILKPLELASRVAALAGDKLATDTLVLDLREVGGFTDFFVICTGANDRQARAVAEHVRERLKAEGVMPRGAAGERDGTWILLDYLDAVLHVFTPAARQFYGLEELWGDVPEIEVAAGQRPG